MIVRRCSPCGQDYPANATTFPVCRICGGKLDGCDVTSSNVEDWAYHVELATAKPHDTAQSADTVRITFEAGPDGVDRMFVDGGDLVRARICHSVDQLVRMARVSEPGGLPVVEVNGMVLELQGYDGKRRRWWAEPYQAPGTD